MREQQASNYGVCTVIAPISRSSLDFPSARLTLLSSDDSIGLCAYKDIITNGRIQNLIVLSLREMVWTCIDWAPFLS